MATNWNTRTIPTASTWTGRVKPGDFVFSTWDESLVAWDSLTFTWDTWGTGIPVTSWTGRTPI